MNAFPSVMRNEKSRALYLAKAFMLFYYRAKGTILSMRKREGVKLILMYPLLEKTNIKPLIRTDLMTYLRGPLLGLYQVLIF